MAGILAIALATLLWGVWGVLDKHALRRAHPFSVQWMYSLPVVVLMPVWFWLAGRVAPAGTAPDRRALLLSVAAGLAGSAATLLVFFAMRDRPASVVIALTAGYPLVTLLIAVATGLETFSAARAGGIALICAGVVVLFVSERG